MMAKQIVDEIREMSFMQMESVNVRNIIFGAGKPKVCVPIVGKTKEEILLQAEQIVQKEPDCIELRIDWFESFYDWSLVDEVLQELRTIIGDIVLLFTFRTTGEGGEATIHYEEYYRLCRHVCESGYIDMLDVEAFMQDDLLKEICEVAHSHNVKVVASNHDFEKTPSEEDIVKRLKFMEHAGADLPKIAVMPLCETDVLTLLSATLRYYETGGKQPIITMSMGEMGVISRVCGGTFGSAMTFAAVGKTSAPGQISIDDEKIILQVLNGE